MLKTICTVCGSGFNIYMDMCPFCRNEKLAKVKGFNDMKREHQIVYDVEYDAETETDIETANRINRIEQTLRENKVSE